MSVYEPTSKKNVVAQALIDAELVIEKRYGETLIDADDVLDSIHEQGWEVVPYGAHRPTVRAAIRDYLASPAAEKALAEACVARVSDLPVTEYAVEQWRPAARDILAALVASLEDGSDER